MLTSEVHEDLAGLLQQLGRQVEALAAAVGRPGVGRLGLRLDELADALGVDKRTIQRERAAGRFPEPDVQMGKCPIWSVASIQAWLARKGRP